MSDTTTLKTTGTQEKDPPLNPFNFIAQILMLTRMRIEEPAPGDDIPRYVRIADGRNSTFVKVVAKGGVMGLSLTVSKLIDLTLQAKDLLVELNSLKALTDVAGLMIKSVLNTDFLNGIFNLMSWDSQGNPGASMKTALDGVNAGEGVQTFLDKIDDFLDYIPHPDDLKRIEYELFLLARVGFGTGSSKGPLASETGKVRLLQWAYGIGWKVNYASESVLYAGARTPISGRREQSYGLEVDGILVYEANKGDSQWQQSDADLIELLKLLESLDYNAGSSGTTLDKINSVIGDFQRINELPITGIVDNATINRLFNLDYANHSLCWAKKYDQSQVDQEKSGVFTLVNPDGDGYSDEGYELNSKKGMEYYVIGKEGNPGLQGWKIKPEPNVFTNFVGLKSREKRNESEPYFNGSLYSEGPAEAGKSFFFAALHTQPWRAGRSGHPGIDNIYAIEPGDSISKWNEDRKVSTMFQDVEVNGQVKLANNIHEVPAGFQLELMAKVRRRWLRNEKKDQRVADQGKIILEYLDSDKLPVGGIEAADSGWLPADPGPDGSHLVDNFPHDQRHGWTNQESPVVVLSPGMDFKDHCIRVSLVGKLNNNWDCDAYFTNVSVWWRLVKEST